MFLMCGGAMFLVVCIAAITALGQNAPATFSSVGSAVTPRTIKSSQVVVPPRTAK